MDEEIEMVTITKAKYDQLVSDAFALTCLERGGVDNWDWYGESMQPWFKKYDPDFEEEAEEDIYGDEE
jgi:hypothetical protein